MREVFETMFGLVRFPRKPKVSEEQQRAKLYAEYADQMRVLSDKLGNAFDVWNKVATPSEESPAWKSLQSCRMEIDALVMRARIALSVGDWRPQTEERTPMFTYGDSYPIQHPPVADDANKEDSYVDASVLHAVAAEQNHV